jgi:hypothetical protein
MSRRIKEKTGCWRFVNRAIKVVAVIQTRSYNSKVDD